MINYFFISKTYFLFNNICLSQSNKHHTMQCEYREHGYCEGASTNFPGFSVNTCK